MAEKVAQSLPNRKLFRFSGFSLKPTERDVILPRFGQNE